MKSCKYLSLYLVFVMIISLVLLGSGLAIAAGEFEAKPYSITFTPGPFGDGNGGVAGIATLYVEETPLAVFNYFIDSEHPEIIYMPGVGIFIQTDNVIDFYQTTGIKFKATN